MKRIGIALVIVSLVAAIPLSGGSAADRNSSAALEKGFQNPPESSRPRVWWHWTGGNISKEGITKDLEWMRRVGIGGAQIADIGMDGGQVLESKTLFFTPAWFDAIRHAALEAERLGLELGIFSSSGWSLTGGPWVQPQQAMKKLVWSETTLQGPASRTVKLPQPPSHTGNFGGLRGAAATQAQVQAKNKAEGYYGDSIVLAYPTPPDEALMDAMKPILTASGGSIDPGVLVDDNAATLATIVAGKDNVAWIQYEFPRPLSIKAITLIAPGRGVPFGQIEVSMDGAQYRTLARLPGAVQYRAGGLKTYAFPETAARWVRVTMTGAPPDPDAVIYQTAPKPARQYQLGEFIVHTGARIDRWEDKAGFNLLYDYQAVSTPPVPAESRIRPETVLDLTSKMDADGMLHWDIPPGNWTILRMGYSLVGSKNRAGTAPGLGLEVDKLNAGHAATYLRGYLDPMERALGALLGKSLRYIMMDSWEAGMQNWTEDMIAQFQKRRGYDPRSYLPALAGRVVGSADLSDRFLWDFRRTIVELVADAHYGTLAAMLRQKGLGIYGEAAGVSMEILEDTLLTKSKVEIPMSEFWLGRMHPPSEYYVDGRMAASAAHIYGKPIVAAESFTGGGYDPPAAYKNLADYWFTQGINRLVIHSSAHQPLDTKPGNTMVGTHFNRNITWAEQAGPVLTHLSRTSYMLQQGHFVADFAYLLPEGAPSSQPFWGAGLQPAPPEGHDYDTLNTDVLLNRLQIAPDGRLQLPDGMSYRMLVLPHCDRMRPEVLRRIRDLVAGGATVVGPKPILSPSLQHGAEKADREVRALAHEIWGDLDGVQRNKHFCGKGLVVWGLPLRQVLELADIPRDAEFSGPLDASIAWIHRRAGNTDIYFVANRTERMQDIQSRFRVAGREAELWHPDTGAIEPASYTISGGRTTVPLRLDPRASLFVVFRHPAAQASRTLRPAAVTPLVSLAGAWHIGFPPNLGAPKKIRLSRLASWTTHPDEGVKYFSGTATYRKTLPIARAWLKPGARLILDLGTVKDLAEVSVNGRPLPLLWKPPYRVDVTEAVQAGSNRLEIKVTNQWTNRQVGDQAAPAGKRVLGAPAEMMGFGGPPALSDAGLIGPVTLLLKAAP